ERDHCARRVELGRHVGEMRLHELEVRELLTELLAANDVRCRLFDRAPRHAERCGPDARSIHFERSQREPQSLADLTEKRIRGNATRREHDSPEWVMTGELNLRELHALCVRRNQETADSFFAER